MGNILTAVNVFVNRRIGGLEMNVLLPPCLSPVNRRIGGLEIYRLAQRSFYRVNRRIGGLEM